MEMGSQNPQRGVWGRVMGKMRVSPEQGVWPWKDHLATGSAGVSFYGPRRTMATVPLPSVQGQLESCPVYRVARRSPFILHILEHLAEVNKKHLQEFITPWGHRGESRQSQLCVMAMTCEPREGPPGRQLVCEGSSRSHTSEHACVLDCPSRTFAPCTLARLKQEGPLVSIWSSLLVSQLGKLRPRDRQGLTQCRW